MEVEDSSPCSQKLVTNSEALCNIS